MPNVHVLGCWGKLEELQEAYPDKEFCLFIANISIFLRPIHVKQKLTQSKDSALSAHMDFDVF